MGPPGGVASHHENMRQQTSNLEPGASGPARVGSAHLALHLRTGDRRYRAYTVLSLFNSLATSSLHSVTVV